MNERDAACAPVLGSSLWSISFSAAGFLENQTFSNEVFTNAVYTVCVAARDSARPALLREIPPARALPAQLSLRLPCETPPAPSPRTTRSARAPSFGLPSAKTAPEKKMPPFLATPHGGTQLSEQPRAFAAEIPSFYATFHEDSLRKLTHWQERESAASVQPKDGAKNPGFSFSGGLFSVPRG